MREIAWRPELLAEVSAALPALRAVAEHRAGVDGVRRVIAKRFTTYPQPQRSDEEWADWWGDYMETLAEVPLASLEAAMRAYVALPDSEFMPKPGRLREMAFLTPCRSLQRYQRAKRAMQIAAEPQEPIKPRVDPAEVKTMLAEFEAKTSAGAKIPELPSIAGKVDEGGITPEMRALIARRKEEARG